MLKSLETYIFKAQNAEHWGLKKITAFFLQIEALLVRKISKENFKSLSETLFGEKLQYIN